MGTIITTPIIVVLSMISLKPSDIIYWVKFITSYLYIQMTRWLTKGRFDLYDFAAEHDPVKINFITASEEIVLESPLEESELQTTNDEVFFYGLNSKSEHLLARIARGANNEAEAWIDLKIENGKTYQLQKTLGFQQRGGEKKGYSCDGFQMHYITPMIIWRIFYNGWLIEKNNNDSTEKMVHVKFALLWRASSVVFDFLSDTDVAALANSLAVTKWSSFFPPIDNVNKALDFYTQCGIINGTINVEGSEKENNIYLFGTRLRMLNNISCRKEANIFHAFGHTFKDGSFFHLTEISVTNVIKNLHFGFVVQPTGSMAVVTDKTINLQKLRETGEDDSEEIKFDCKDLVYELKGKVSQSNLQFERKLNLEGDVKFQTFKFFLNSLDGAGFVMKGKLKASENVTSSLKVDKAMAAVPLVTHFTEKNCQDSSVTGGKGSSLGKLYELSNHLKEFIVPDGVVITTAAYELFITEDVLKDIECLENVLYGKSPGDAKQNCQRIMEKISKLSIPDKVLHSIVNNLQKIFPDNNVLKFAVRSSATGEDTEGMSAAGQMETFLGISGLSQILSSLKMCWASQFSYTAVQYKRQNGQILNSPMAVVIQKMIPCDVAGVLFTCDPLNGNPTKICITANYGLGESVVSASEEPDTIEIRRNADDELSIQNKIIGAKCQRVVLQEDNDVISEEVVEEERQACCLSDDQILQLATLAIKLQKCYRSHQDIEFGFWKTNLYIFQARPVTTGFGETDFEIDHELDAPLRVENEFFSVTNVGEVMPGAMSTLSLDLIPKFLQLTDLRNPRMQWQTKIGTSYFPQGMVPMYSRIMFYLNNFFEHRKQEDVQENDFIAASFISFFGRVIEVEEIYEIVKYRFKNVKRSFIQKIPPFFMFSKLLSGKKLIVKTSHKYANYKLPVEKCRTSQKMLDALLYACTDITDTMECHALNTGTSMLLNMLILLILMKFRGGINADVYRDFAQLVQTRSEVESADVPAAIERLAFYITKDIRPEEFKKMTAKEIRKWLEESQGLAGKRYREFLEKHEHRCLKEFDLRSKTWGMDPDPLIHLLKNLVGNVSDVSQSKKEDSVDKMLSNLGPNLGFKSRFLLKFLIPFSRRGVQNREAAKSLLIKALHAWRKGYYHLAKLMVLEGRIPDEDLLFFMTLDEIKDLLQTRSPKILTRAAHRRRRYPILDKNIFPEIIKGFPEPVGTKNFVDNSEVENFSMKGAPVSPGMTKAFVRVAMSLEEAEDLKKGEILVTYSTDIGWSPYFPILAGVVTEIGGLISHGAVVSREYGLPCIAGLRGATRQFKTGDYVLLDGNKGILQRLKKPENSEDIS